MDDMNDMQDDDATPMNETERLTAANQERLAALNQLGVNINGVNEALLVRMMEELLGPVRAQDVKLAHQEWLAEQLSSAEQQMEQFREMQAEMERKATILRRS